MAQASGSWREVASLASTSDGASRWKLTRVRIPSWLSTVVLAAAMVVPMVPPVVADPSPTGRTPKLFWTPQRQAVWNQMRLQNHPWWQQVKSNADLSATSGARYGDLGEWATMVYQVTGDPVYAAKAWS